MSKGVPRSKCVRAAVLGYSRNGCVEVGGVGREIHQGGDDADFVSFVQGLMQRHS